jgi:hypothetical protein
MVGVAAKLGVHEEPRRFLGVHGCELKVLEDGGETAPQVVDPYETGAVVLPAAGLGAWPAVYGGSRRGP